MPTSNEPPSPPSTFHGVQPTHARGADRGGCASCRVSIDLDRTQVLVFRRGRIAGVRCVFCETERSFPAGEPEARRIDVS